jgi:hypothetical protein
MTTSLLYRDVSSAITPRETEGNKYLDFSFVSTTPHRCMDWESWELMEEVLDCRQEAIVGDRLQNGLIQYLWNHNPNQVRGVIQAISWRDEKGYCTAKLSRSPEAEQLWRDVQDEIIKGVSVGYRVHEYQLISKAVWETGEDRFDAKLISPKKVKAVKWEPFEISAASIPADATVGVGRSLDLNQRNPTINLPRFIANIGVEKVKKAIDNMTQQTQDIRSTPEYRELDDKYRESQSLAHTLRAENDQLRTQVQGLQGDVAKLESEAKISNKYAKLKSKADELLNDAKLTAHEHAKYFSKSIEEILAEPEPLTKLSVLEMYLDTASERPPNLKTQPSQIPPEISESGEKTEVKKGERGAAIKLYEEAHKRK